MQFFSGKISDENLKQSYNVQRPNLPWLQPDRAIANDLAYFSYPLLLALLALLLQKMIGKDEFLSPKIVPRLSENHLCCYIKGLWVCTLHTLSVEKWLMGTATKWYCHPKEMKNSTIGDIKVWVSPITIKATQSVECTFISFSKCQDSVFNLLYWNVSPSQKSAVKLWDSQGTLKLKWS